MGVETDRDALYQHQAFNGPPLFHRNGPYPPVPPVEGLLPPESGAPGEKSAFSLMPMPFDAQSPYNNMLPPVLPPEDSRSAEFDGMPIQEADRSSEDRSLILPSYGDKDKKEEKSKERDDEESKDNDKGKEFGSDYMDEVGKEDRIVFNKIRRKHTKGKNKN